MLRSLSSRWWRLFRLTAALAVVLAGVSALHPYGVLKKPHKQNNDLETVITDRRAATIVARSCANCHSDDTKWPWYSYVSPISWLVEKDVADARAHFNLSTWDGYSSEEKSEILADLARVVANREMPLRHYLLLHHDAQLSDEDAQVLVKWAGRERRALRTGAAEMRHSCRCPMSKEKSVFVGEY